MSSMRVLQVIQHLQPGGIESMALDLIQGQPSEQLSLVALEGHTQQALSGWPRLRAFKQQFRCLAKQSGIDWRLIWRLRQLLRTGQYDVVHTHHIGPLLYAGLAGRLARVKTIVHTEHDAWHLQQPKRRWLQKLLIKLVRPVLVADADLVAQAMQAHLGELAITVINNGIDTGRFCPADRHLARQQLSLPNNQYIIGSAGRLELVKGHADLLKAFAQLPDDLHLAIAGSGSQAQHLHILAEQLGIASRVSFLGHLDKMEQFYQAIDVFCLPSHNEGFPLSTLEAQSCGKAAVVTDVGGSKETLCAAYGNVVPAHNPNALAHALQQQIEQFNKGQKVATACRQHVLQNSSLKSMLAAYRALYLGVQ